LSHDPVVFVLYFFCVARIFILICLSDFSSTWQ
jgi:hypothetical protein